MTLASAKKMGELHGIPSAFVLTEDWSFLSLSFVPEALAKIRDSSVPDEHSEGFSVPVLRGGTNRRYRLLGPVRAVRISEGSSSSQSLRSSILCPRIRLPSGFAGRLCGRACLSGRGYTVHRMRAYEVRGFGPSFCSACGSRLLHDVTLFPWIHTPWARGDSPEYVEACASGNLGLTLDLFWFVHGPLVLLVVFSVLEVEP